MRKRKSLEGKITGRDMPPDRKAKTDALAVFKERIEGIDHPYRTAGSRIASDLQKEAAGQIMLSRKRERRIGCAKAAGKVAGTLLFAHATGVAVSMLTHSILLGTIALFSICASSVALAVRKSNREYEQEGRWRFRNVLTMLADPKVNEPELRTELFGLIEPALGHIKTSMAELIDEGIIRDPQFIKSVEEYVRCRENEGDEVFVEDTDMQIVTISQGTSPKETNRAKERIVRMYIVQVESRPDPDIPRMRVPVEPVRARIAADEEPRDSDYAEIEVDIEENDWQDAPAKKLSRD